MKYSCGLIRDLLPLYCDGICSEDSAQAVRKHVDECAACRNIYAEMSQPTALEGETCAVSDAQQLASIKKVKKTMTKRNFAFGGAGIVVGLVIAAIFIRLLLLGGGVALLLWDSENAKIEVHEDVARYQDYIGANAKEPYLGKWGMDESIFPEAPAGEVQEFRFVYYNPWDAQYVAYLTVEYTRDAYQKELARLGAKGTEAYIGYYGVTDAPAGYRLLAMDSDEYQGFVYAMTPENGDTSVTYVMLVFCNYFLDLEIADYVPEAYLLQGFDAGVDNPYRKEKLEGR